MPAALKRAVSHAVKGYSAMQERRLSDAVAEYRAALSEWPDFPEVLSNLGRAMLSLGEAEQAVTLFRRAIEVQPGLRAAQSNLLVALLHTPDVTPEQIFAAHRQWGVHFAGKPASIPRTKTNFERLRIGYVSGNFRLNAETSFLVPVLRHHDRNRFEIYCYSNVETPDEFTIRIRRLADLWRDIHAIPDQAAAQRIRRDGIHLLVDCPGHLSGGRLSLFALKPAPVQISYPTYPATTGLTQMDYRITDRHADPEGVTDHLHTERLVRLTRVYCCYQPPAGAPRVNELPALKQGAITFGAFNRPHKTSSAALRLWASILRRVPGSRIVLHHAFMGGGVVAPEMEERIRRQFEAEDVDPGRIVFVGGLPMDEHLALFQQIDVSLDTFPYNGATTTCDMLWMGVPVVTLAGCSHVSRTGVSLLNAVGLTNWIAGSEQEYVEIAVRMAGDLAKLGSLRSELRARMRRSPLTRSAAYARDLERAYLWMWKQSRLAGRRETRVRD